MLIAGALAIGLLMRFVITDSSPVTAALSEWLPWLKGTPVTLYFSDGQYIVPVSQSLSGDAASPEGIVETLLRGPSTGSGLISLIPTGTAIRSLSVVEGVVTLDLSGAFLDSDYERTALALIWSLRSWPDIQEVQIRVAGVPIQPSVQDFDPMFFVHDGLLVAVPDTATTPRTMIQSYLATDVSELVGLPADVQLLSYDLNPNNGLLSLNFSYTQSLRDYAIENPDTMRQILIGLIATLTHYPQVKAVRLDFDGHSQLGLGQCAYLLHAPQTRPTVLNDVRLLGG
jgi:spore germination protein GerM